jgi:hypothetical protein
MSANGFRPAPPERSSRESPVLVVLIVLIHRVARRSNEMAYNEPTFQGHNLAKSAWGVMPPLPPSDTT